MDYGDAVSRMWLDLGRYRLGRRALEDVDFLLKYSFLNEEPGFFFGDIEHPKFFSMEEIQKNLREKQKAFGMSLITTSNLLEIAAHSVMNIQKHAILDDGNPYGIFLYRFDDERTFEFIALDRGPGFKRDADGRICVEDHIKKGRGLGLISDISDSLVIETSGFLYDSRDMKTVKKRGKAINGCRLRAIKYF